jgi:hypothetical protein
LWGGAETTTGSDADADVRLLLVFAAVARVGRDEDDDGFEDAA